MLYNFTSRNLLHEIVRFSPWISIAILFYLAMMFLNPTPSTDPDSKNVVTSLPTSVCCVKSARPIDSLLHEEKSLAPWECDSSDESFAVITNVTKGVLSKHPLVLLDIALFIILRTPPSTSILSALFPRTFFSRRMFVWWLPRRLSRLHLSTTMASWKGLGRRTLQSTFKCIGRLYKNRSRFSTLSDYTWYVGTSGTTTTSDDA